MLLSKTHNSLTYLITKLSRHSFGKLMLLPATWISSVKTNPQQVHDMVDDMVQDSQFLRDTQPSNNVARFHPDEVETGDCLGQEQSFSETHEIKGLYREELYSAPSEEQETSRIELTDIVMYKGRSIYAVKQVNTSLRSQHEVHIATARLLLEANYLSRIKHPNIMGFHGFVSSGAPPGGKGCYDDFAIISDRISETLEQRIQRWNKQGEATVNTEHHAAVRLKTQYMLQIAEAISYLHSRRLAVRNISTRNIGFADNDVIKLINLENVIQLPDDDASYVEHGLKADVYDWAVAFIELLLQRPVRRHDFGSGSDLEQVLEQDDQLPSLEECGYLPYNVQDLLANAWSEDVKDRLNIEEVVERMEWILFGFEAVQEDRVIRHGGWLQEPTSGQIDETDETSLGLDLDMEAENEADWFGCDETSSSFLPCHLLLPPSEAVESLELSDSSSDVDLQPHKIKIPRSFRFNAFAAYDRSSGHCAYEMARCA